MLSESRMTSWPVQLIYDINEMFISIFSSISHTYGKSIKILLISDLNAEDVHSIAYNHYPKRMFYPPSTDKIKHSLTTNPTSEEWMKIFTDFFAIGRARTVYITPNSNFSRMGYLSHLPSSSDIQTDNVLMRKYHFIYKSGIITSNVEVMDLLLKEKNEYY